MGSNVPSPPSAPPNSLRAAFLFFIFALSLFSIPPYDIPSPPVPVVATLAEPLAVPDPSDVPKKKKKIFKKIKFKIRPLVISKRQQSKQHTKHVPSTKKRTGSQTGRTGTRLCYPRQRTHAHQRTVVLVVLQIFFFLLTVVGGLHRQLIIPYLYLSKK